MYSKIKVYQLLPLLLVSLPTLSIERVFKVTTQINLAQLSNFTIDTSVSRDYVILNYDESRNRFDDEKVIINNQSNISISELKDYGYIYSVEDISSSCRDINNESNSIQSFMSLKINGVEYATGEVTPKINFDTYSYDNMKSKQDTLVLTNNLDIPSGELLRCDGMVSLHVELYL